jgi:hypothetical protein
MVRIINYEQRKTEDGKEFFVLQIQGGVEMVKSQQTGNYYVTAKKATFSSTFDEVTCQSLIGQEMPGSIAKVACAPYEYTIKDTGEVITISHKFEYVEEKAINNRPERSESTIDSFMESVSLSKAFSLNGELTH